jgi:hypothetical protein
MTVIRKNIDTALNDSRETGVEMNTEKTRHMFMFHHKQQDKIMLQ